MPGKSTVENTGTLRDCHTAFRRGKTTIISVVRSQTGWPAVEISSLGSTPFTHTLPRGVHSVPRLPPATSSRNPISPMEEVVRWKDLTKEQRVWLAAWYALADAAKPTRDETLPLEFSRAISELTAAAGKYQKHHFARKHLQTGVTHGRQRKPRARRGRGQLAT